jgi:hypothetical protein
VKVTTVGPALFPYPSLKDIAPLDLSNKVLTAASFNVITAVAERPSSVFTILIEIGPDAGSAI